MCVCAGIGAAWLWRGAPGEQLGKATIATMKRFLIDSNSAVKVLGGARFDPHSHVSPEWEEFGSYYMILPSIEMVRAHMQTVFMLESCG
jgi:hypothetical protein